MTEIAREAFMLLNWINGCISGGIEAPREIVSIVEDNDIATVTWKNPAVCGLSDCRYHNIDTGTHKSVFQIIENMLFLNGSSNIFDLETGYDEVNRKITEFYERHNLMCPLSRSIIN